MNKTRLIYPGFWFGKSSMAEALEMAQRGAGGFCVYGGTEESLADLIQRLRAASPLPHLFICADYEDGAGRWISTQKALLTNLAIGATGQEEAAFQKGLSIARQAKALGVDWVFAPVLDLCDEPQNPIVNTRSFGTNPQTVGRLGRALCRGLRCGGVANSIKHFPGHGRTTQDSHLGLPVLQRTSAQLKQHELIPFFTALPEADSVMAGHLLLPDIDKERPTSLSALALTALLKQEMGFQGIVLTDALCMKAIGDEKQAALHALRAGAHILLAPEKALELADFLNKQDQLENYVQTSTQLQDALAQKLALCSPQEGLCPQDFNTRYSAACAVLQGSFSVQSGDEISYLELGNEEAFTAQTFLQTLQNNGVRIKKYTPGQHVQKLIAASFSHYKAFKGHINLSEQERVLLCSAAQAAPQSLFLSFGSPFGTENIFALTAKLFLFSPAEEAQVCAAEIILGKQKALGKWPFSPIGH